MQRLIVTGPNGAGKSYLAAKLAAIRPNVPIISFDNIKLTKNWEQRPKSQIESKLLQALRSDAWILEGGPSLIPYADSVIWLDPAQLGASLAFGDQAVTELRTDSSRASFRQCRLAMGTIPICNS